ncbi:MAG: hypothetical protein ACHQSE_06920 [Gemmatimonadales bacterium]
MRAPAPDGARTAARRAPVCLAALTAALASALAGTPAALAAQAVAFKPPVQVEMRADLLAGPPAGAQAGVGANIAAGYYLRIGVDAAAGASMRDASAFTSGRVDVVTRYLLDPFREFRWAPYVGAGFTAQWDRRATRRGDLLLLAGIEGPVHGGWLTSVELGLGGGARLGVVLRRARSNGR